MIKQPQDAKKAALAKALKQNLLRRKQQQKARKATKTEKDLKS